jgi:hypothetical protein
LNYFEGKNILSIHVVPLHKNLMNLFFLLLVLILAGRLESSFFNLDMIKDDELKSISSTMMPNITTSSDVSKEIGVRPDSADKGLYGIAAAACNSAIVARPTTSNSFVDSSTISKLFESFSQDSTVEAEIGVDPFSSPSEPAATSSITADSELTPSATPQNEMHSSGNSFDCRSSSALSSQASNNHPRILVFHNFQPSSGTSSLPLPNTLSGSLNNDRVPKRAREETTVDFETENYINREVRMANYRKPEKKDALKKVIKLIARNDYEGFKDHEPVFKEVFNRDYINYERRYRMFYYIIRFGATNFLCSPLYLKCSREFNENSNIEAAFDHLIKTKTFNVATEFIFSCRFSGSVTKIISVAIKARYPNIHFLDLAAFEFDYLVPSNIINEFYQSIHIENEQEKLIYFTNCLEKNSAALLSYAHYSHARYVEAFFKYSEYFLSTEIGTKILFAKFAILNKDFDSMTKIIELYPSILSSGTLFAFASRCQFTKSLQYFMEIVPEYAALEFGEPSPILISIYMDSLSNIKTFYECGYDFTQEIEYYGVVTSPIYMAFNFKSVSVFDFLIEKFGKEIGLAQLLKIYGTEFELIMQASRIYPNPQILSKILNLLELGLNFVRFGLDKSIKD